MVKKAIAALVCVCLCSALWAFKYAFPAGFYIDVPAGFVVTQSDQNTRYAFADPNSVMEFDIFVYDRYADSMSAMNDIKKKLASKGDASEYTYQGRPAVISELLFNLNGEDMAGYAIVIEAAKKAQTVTHVALLAYCPETEFKKYADFVLSCLDAFSIDKAALDSPGPLSQFSRAWPPARSATKKVATIDGATAVLGWNEEEAQEQDDTNFREYKVLTAYEKDEVNWQDAWARFYRMAYRQCGSSVDELAVTLEAQIRKKLKDKNVTDASTTDLAREVLAWVQGFTYERQQDGTDFISPVRAAFTSRGDCDSRVIVAARILKRMGIDSILMVSAAYSHGMIGIDVPGGGQRFDFEGKAYLVGETTAKVGLGMIASDMADFSKWMGVAP